MANFIFGFVIGGFTCSIVAVVWFWGGMKSTAQGTPHLFFDLLWPSKDGWKNPFLYDDCDWRPPRVNQTWKGKGKPGGK